jgi:hypothetical protein
MKRHWLQYSISTRGLRVLISGRRAQKKYAFQYKHPAAACRARVKKPLERGMKNRLGRRRQNAI